MRRIIPVLLLLLVEPATAQSLKDRIELEATERVAAYLSDTVEITLVSEGRDSAFAACVGSFVANSFREATGDRQRNDLRSWIDAGKRHCG